ncbi:restriction endonuclease subunit S [Paraglaciecola agarilytica]|uniref:restriction endonuclease subunit S n=1 Tax=Paraglaciecola chathamensis TaxID=368405 RepID=UPI001C09111E|nr:restriction endonuclease subunit S [Paraglaciecola agarilytica]MBU3017985.1 restriction endonuclease subunit S [Paraglaciecola agarilytica]
MSDLPNSHSREETSSSNAVAPERHSLEGGNLQSLITEHLDIWTAAIKTKSSAGRGSSKKLELVGVKKLRELILELAVRGKLVPQDPNDEPASELLKKIEAEKARLLNEGKIKKQKPLPKITDEEMRFELPKNWEWERLTNLYDVRDGTHDTPKYHESGYPLVTSKNLSSGTLDLTNVKLISEEDYIKINERSKVERNDILFAMIGSIGNPVLVDIEPEFSIKNVALFKYYSQKLSSPSYLLRFLLFAETTMKAEASGAVQSFVSLGAVRKFVIAVPPLAEQHRIVAKVDELMTLCDQLEAQTENSIQAHQLLVETLLATLTNAKDTDELNESWQTISQHFDVLFTTQASIDQLKQTILQLAVMGKLVKQNPKDEPASKLLERIATEKQQLIKDGKMKKQKPLPPVTDEEKPFELPMGWEWSRLPDIGELARGKSKHRPRNDPSLYVGGNIKLVQTGDVANANRNSDVINTFTALYNSKGLSQSRLWPKGTMCITIAANIADTGILGFDACFPDSVVGFTPFEQSMNVKYFEYFIRTAKSNLEAYAPATAQKNINLEILGQLLVPLPPLNELNHIVLKIVALMDLCDSLKANLNQAQTTQLHLTDAIVEQTL